MTRTRALIGALLAATLLAVLVVIVPTVQYTIRHGLFDFGVFLRTARCLSTGACDPYTSSAALELAPNLNPPHFHLLLWPLLGLRAPVAFVIWLCVSAGCIAIGVARIASALEYRWRPLDVAVAVTVISWSGLTSVIAGSGQIAPLLFLLLVEAWRAGRESQWARAGLCFGLLLSVKPFFLIFLPAWLLRRQWRLAAIAVATTVLVLLIGVSIFGIPTYAAWLRDGLGAAVVTGDYSDGSLQSFFARTLMPTRRFVPLWQASADLIPLAWMAACGFVGLLSLMLVAVAHRDQEDALWLLLLSAMLLISPKGWFYYGWLLLPPAAGLWTTDPDRRGKLLIAALVSFMPSTWTIIGQPSAVLTVTLGSLYCWLWLWLWTTAAAALRYDQPHAAMVDRPRDERRDVRDGAIALSYNRARRLALLFDRPDPDRHSAR